VEAAHASELGLSSADDRDIIAWCRTNGAVAVTLDADFHALIALSGEDTVRGEDTYPGPYGPRGGGNHLECPRDPEGSTRRRSSRHGAAGPAAPAAPADREKAYMNRLAVPSTGLSSGLRSDTSSVHSYGR